MVERRTRRARWVRTAGAVAAALVAAAGLGLVTGCVPRYEGNPDGPRVAVIGDSILGLTAEEIPPVLVDDYQQSITARSGKMTYELIGDAMDYAVNRPPDVAVVGLGTNDAALYDVFWDLKGMGTLADQKAILDILGSAPCVVWVNVNEHMADVPDRSFGRHARSYNQGLAHWQQQDPRLHLVDWSAAVGADPSLVLGDGAHPSQKGQDTLALMVRDAVDACTAGS